MEAAKDRLAAALTLNLNTPQVGFLEPLCRRQKCYVVSHRASLSLGQGSPAQVAPNQPYTVEYYYKVQWGHQQEFLQLFLKNRPGKSFRTPSRSSSLTFGGADGAATDEKAAMPEAPTNPLRLFCIFI